MKKATYLTLFTCLFLAGLIVFNSISCQPVLLGKKGLFVSGNDHRALKSVCTFSIEEKEGKERLGHKNSSNQSVICLLPESSRIKCDKIRFFFAYHIPDFLQGTEETPLYLTYRSILI